MSKQQQKRIRPLVGRFVGWGDEQQPHRYINIATADGEQLVKVSKSLRPQIQDWQPGIWLTLLGRERVDRSTGEVEIKVKQLLTSPRASPPMPSSLPNSVATCRPDTTNPVRSQIKVCQGSSCRRKGSEEICKSMQAYFDRNDLNDRVEIKAVKCLHQCKSAPHAIVTTSAANKLSQTKHYHQLALDRVKSILERHFPIDSAAKSIGINAILNFGNYLQKYSLFTSDRN
jgi:hypothetical protein